MSVFLKEGSRVKIRRPTSADQDEFISLMRQSRDLHAPWCFPPVTEEMFANYLKTRDQENQDGFLVCHAETHAIMGVINLNEIVRRCFQSAYLGYYIGVPFVGPGVYARSLDSGHSVCIY